MFWGWMWKSDCVPVSGGGIPPDIPRIEVKLTFSDGGMMEFNEAYIRLRERLFQWTEMHSELGAGSASSDIPDEPLPAYSGPSEEDLENEGEGEEQQDTPPAPALAATSSTAPAPAPAPVGAGATSSAGAGAGAAALGETAPVQRPDSSANRPAPNEPPPNYDEAQAQQISIRLEDHIRDEVERGESRN
jgi:WW domain-binding protein 2